MVGKSTHIEVQTRIVWSLYIMEIFRAYCTMKISGKEKKRISLPIPMRDSPINCSTGDSVDNYRKCPCVNRMLLGGPK
jgi:hypothetical protein